MNPIRRLIPLLKTAGTVNLITKASLETKAKFGDYCVAEAKDDVDLTKVRTMAETAYHWWNDS